MKQVINNIRWFAATMSVWTMTFSPLALGYESKRVKASQIQQAIEVLGLNKKQTLGQFFEKNKAMMPDSFRNMFAVYVKANANQPMPQFEVVSVKSSSGEYIPNIRASQGNELFNLQWFGEPKKFIKFQNTNLREVDVVNFKDMFERVMTIEPRLRKQSEPKLVGRMIAPGKFKYPTPTARGWKKMSAREKATYMVNLRLLWQDAKDVLKYAPKAQQQQAKPKKSAESFFEKNQFFFSLFFGQPAEAAAEARNMAGSCVIAGYVSEYRSIGNGRTVCSSSVAKNKYKDDELYRLASNKCAVNTIVCNPYVYGAPNGQPVCVSTTDNNQIYNATTFDGACDRGSRLQSSETEHSIVKDQLDNSKLRYSPDNMKYTEAELRTHFENDQKEHKQLVDSYLLGMLKLRGKVNASVTRIEDVHLNADNLALVRQIKDQFSLEITKAKDSCNSVDSVQHAANGRTVIVEPQYWAACDQLQRRFLFIDDAIKRNCEANGQTYNPQIQCCDCGTPPTPPIAGPTPGVEPQPTPPGPTPPGNQPGVPTPNNPGTGPIAGPGPTPPAPVNDGGGDSTPVPTPATPNIPNNPGTGPIAGPTPGVEPQPTPPGPTPPGNQPGVPTPNNPGTGPIANPGDGSVPVPTPNQPGVPTPNNPGTGPIAGPTPGVEPQPTPPGPTPPGNQPGVPTPNNPGTGPIAGPTPGVEPQPTPPGPTPPGNQPGVPTPNNPGTGPIAGPGPTPNNPGTITSPTTPSVPTPNPIGGTQPLPHDHSRPDPNCPYEEQPATNVSGNTPICNGSGADFPCRCSDGQLASNIVASNGQSSADCSRVDAGGDRGGRNKKDCGVFCWVGKALPYVAVLAGAYLIYRFLSPKKPALAGAPDACPAGTVRQGASCTSGVSCPAGSNQIPINGSCQCPQSCEALGLVTGPACRCVQGTPTTPTTPNFPCPDGSRAVNYEACPRYACWDCNSYRDPARECPPRPANPPACSSSATKVLGTSK